MSTALPRTERMHPEVPEFVVMELDGTRHPALDGTANSGVAFQSRSQDQEVEQVRIFDCNELYLPCSSAANELISTANKYSKKRSVPLLMLTDSHTWAEVEASVLSACDSLEAVAAKDKDRSGFAGKIKSAFRALCQRANIGLNFTNLVPSDIMCGSVLCGGLKMVFTALQQSSNYREDIYKAIEELPFIVNDHAAYIRIEKQDEELHRRNAALHVALFKLMECILSWFAKNPVSTSMKMLVHPQGFADMLKNRQADVQRAASRFEKHALLLHNQRHNDSMELQHWMAYELHKTKEDVAVIRARCEVLETISRLLQQTHESVSAEKTFEALFPMPKVVRRQRSAAELRERLLQKTEYDPDLVDRDISNLLRHRLGFMRIIDGGRVAELHNHPQFQAWLSLARSSVLFVEGRCDTTNNPDVAFVAAQVSEFALKLHREVVESPVHTIPIAFFYSEHRKQGRDRLAHANGLIWMLLLQLVDRYEKFSASDLERSLSLTMDGETSNVCNLFSKLVSRLPRTVILLLVVEGLDVLLGPGNREELKYVVRRLVDIQRRVPSATVKMIFTSTTSSEFLENVFEENEILRLPRIPRRSSPYYNLEWKDASRLIG